MDSKTKKMVLVPHELLSILKASQMRSNRHEEGVAERLEDLDTEMSSVLNSKDCGCKVQVVPASSSALSKPKG